MIALQIQHLGFNVTKLGYDIDQEDIPTVVKYTLMEKSPPDLELEKTLSPTFI